MKSPTDPVTADDIFDDKVAEALRVAKSKAGNTMISGMKGVFSVAGRITPDGALALVMVGEYSDEAGKALCSQSWNLSGPRVDSKPKK